MSGASKDSNFRSHYYGKVGFRGVDDKKALELLLCQDPVDLVKLTDFALKCSSVPASDRFLVWKLLLSIISRFSESREGSWQRTLKAFKICAHSVPSLDPRCKTKLEKMGNHWRFTNCNRQLGSLEDVQDFLSIYKYVEDICKTEETAYYISKKTHAKLVLLNYEDYAAFYAKMMRSSNKNLLNHLETIGMSAMVYPWQDWIKRAFTGILKSSNLCRILDKVIAGSVKILVYMAVIMTEYHASKLMECDNSLDAVIVLCQSPASDDEHNVVQATITRWAREGRQLIAQPTPQHHGANGNNNAYRERNAENSRARNSNATGAHESNPVPSGSDVNLPTRITVSEEVNEVGVETTNEKQDEQKE